MDELLMVTTAGKYLETKRRTTLLTSMNKPPSSWTGNERSPEADVAGPDKGATEKAEKDSTGITETTW